MAIDAQEICKEYVLGEGAGLFRRLMKRSRSKDSPTSRTFHALRDLTFQIPEGQAVGIIGQNGAGKSTLLKILSRITEPTSGRAVIRGRVASLLEVGTGFHPELTGRENIFMNGAILGMKRAEIRRSFDEIVSFADIERFLDTPVKRYSSGMYVRLAFSVAAHLEPEILVIDEVLAVGDVQFQKKCMGKMGNVSRSGRTILFVSHNMTAVRQLTSRCLLLKEGSICFDGEPDRAIELYAENVASAFEQGADLSRWRRPEAGLGESARFLSLRFDDHTAVFAPGESISIVAQIRTEQAYAALGVSGTVFQTDGVPVGSFFAANAVCAAAVTDSEMHVRLGNLRLAPGRYTFGLALVEGRETTGHRDHDLVLDVLPFEVTAVVGEEGTVGAWPRNWGAVRFDSPQITRIGNG